MIKNEQGGFIKFLTVLLMLLKVSWFRVVSDMRPETLGRYLHFSFSPALFAIGKVISVALAVSTQQAQLVNARLSVELTQANSRPVWSMPGGFTSSEREGYQPVDEERPQSTNNVKPSPSQAIHAQQTAPGAYQV